MKVTINNKEYSVVFNYAFVKHVMEAKKLKSFTEYEKWLLTFSFNETEFGPEHLEQFAELLLYGINAVKGRKLKMPVEQMANVFWNDLSLMQETANHFLASQPKNNNDVVDPASRKLGK